MDHLVLIGSVLVVTVTGAGAAAALLLHNRLRTRATLATAGVTLVFLASLLLGVVSQYLSAVLPPDAYPSGVFAAVGTVVGVAVYAGMLVLLRAVDPERGILHAVASTLAILAQLARGFAYLAGADALVATLRLPAIGLISVFLLYAGIIFRIARTRLSSATVSALVGRLGMLLIVFAPASTAVYVSLAFLPPSYRPSVSLDVVFAVGWSIVLISGFVRYLGKPEAPLESGVGEGFRNAFGITDREAEVIALVAEGLSNQQIADRIHVSLATVRTHLYNVFRKTGARSRVDLLRMAAGYRE